MVMIEKTGKIMYNAENIHEKRKESSDRAKQHINAMYPDKDEVDSKCHTTIVKVKIEDGTEEIDMYVFKPKELVDTTGNAAVVYIHGGGAVMTTADMYIVPCQRLCLMANCVFFVPDFRNAPEAKTPKGFQDVYDSFRHAYENAESFGVDKT